MPSPVLASTPPSIITKDDAYSQYPSQSSSLIALALPHPGMLSIISPDSPGTLTLRDNIEAPESILDIAEQAYQLSRETLGLSTQAKAGMSESFKARDILRGHDILFLLRILLDLHILFFSFSRLPYSLYEIHKIILDTASSQTANGMLGAASARLNKFVRRLHDMLQSEKDSGVVEWRKGLLVLHSTNTFAKQILPKYFNTRNFKTFRRQLNYYGFVHVRSFSTTGSTTTALWVNQDLAKKGSDDIASVLMLKRVEPCESGKTAEGRRVRKELAIHTVEEDLGVNAKTLQMEQIRSLATRAGENCVVDTSLFPLVPMEIQYTQSTGAHSVSSASNDEQPDLASESADSSSLESSPPSDDESTSAANLLLLLSKVRSMV
jgi:hypothetical protein